MIAASGILVSIIGTFMVSVKEGGDPQKALNRGEFGSAAIMVAVIYVLIQISSRHDLFKIKKYLLALVFSLQR